VPGAKTNRILFVVLLILLSGKPVSSQQLNYQEIFGSNWDKALSFVEQNRNWIEPKLNQYKVSYPDAIAVIFPELVRYSALRDKIEITLLKTLYTNLGEEYANFSIGPFQMKPSFGEMIREKARGAMGSKADKFFKRKSDYDDILSFRASIVSDLEDPKIQLNYLIAFVKICEDNFNLKSKNNDDRIIFLATAYNYGFWKTTEQIENMIDKKYFNTTIFKTTNYSYSDVSLFWYHYYLTETSGSHRSAPGKINH
jgi:hypothetical protein